MTVAFVELEEEIPGNGEPSAFVQCVTLPGLDRASFHAADEGIRPDGEVPEAITADRRRAGADVTLVPPAALRSSAGDAGQLVLPVRLAQPALEQLAGGRLGQRL
jgi:hypothetical protein